MSEHSATNIKCDKCDKDFEGNTDMITHFLTEHPENRFKCDSCDNKSDKKVHLTVLKEKEHSRKHHKDKIIH